MRNNVLLALILAAAPARADWLADARKTAAAAIPAENSDPKPRSSWLAYEAPSRLFRAELPVEGWNAFEEDDDLGTVVRILGPDDPSGALRASMTVRLIDRDAPGYLPVAAAVDAMRRPGRDRDVSSVRPLRVDAGLARIFEITETRRVPIDEGPSVPRELHQYVAVIPRGEGYFVVRLVSARENYLDYRDDFLRFLRSLRPIGVR